MAGNNTDILPLFQKRICPYATNFADVITDNVNATDYRYLTRITCSTVWYTAFKACNVIEHSNGVCVQYEIDMDRVVQIAGKLLFDSAIVPLLFIPHYQG
jgi:hypothetical protein